jgi:BON domain
MKNRHGSLLALVVAIAVPIAGALLLSACRPNESVEGQARDAKIKTQIKSKLASDVGASTLTSIQVNVTNGVVTLAGPVHNEDEKARAEAAARTVEGVVSVTNALQILVPDTSATPSGASPHVATVVAVTPAPTP